MATETTQQQRVVWVDWLRITACFLVMLVHSSEPFYLNGYDTQILTPSDLFWVSLFDSASRMAVPLFIIASSFLLFPLQYSSGEFFRRRVRRLLVPFIVWSIAYAFVWGNPVTNLKSLLFNFNYTAVHLWFVYMLVGLYLIMPVLSPWAKRVSKRELRIYLLIWLFTTIIPILRVWLTSGDLTLAYGSGWLPSVANYPLWGECNWNPYGAFYYVSGMVGYLLVGLYVRRFGTESKLSRTLCISLPLLLIGMAIVAGGYAYHALSITDGQFPITGPTPKTVLMESTWYNDTIGVALMTIGTVLLFKRIKSSSSFYNKIVVPVSKASYGMYLIHMLLLTPVSTMLRNNLGIGQEGSLGIWTTAVQILLTAAITFVISAIVSILIQGIPKVGKYIMG